MKECLVKIMRCLVNNFLLIFLIFLAIFYIVAHQWLFDRFIIYSVSGNLFQADGFQNLLLLLAFEAAFYYAYITRKMWQNDKKPVLRIQWHDIANTSEEPYATYRREKEIEYLKSDYEKTHDKPLKEGSKEERVLKDKAETYNYIYNSFTDLQLVNNGKGVAIDLKIEAEYKNCKKVIRRLKNVTAIGSCGHTQLKYQDHPEVNRHKVFNDEKESYKESFIIEINYFDSEMESHKITFESDENYNDGFRIINNLN